MKRKFTIGFSWEPSLGSSTGRMAASDELVWLKRAFFTIWRIGNTVNWENMYDEIKIAIKQSAQAAPLHGRIAGEEVYA